MKQNAPILLAVLLGAFTTAIGMGLFLKLANDDRARLSEEINRARDIATQAVADKERIATEASEKVEEANAEILNAQRVLADIEKERRLLSEAVRLDPPATRELRNWKTIVSSDLRLSVSLPPGTDVSTNNAFMLTATRTNQPNDPSWLRIAAFDARALAEQEAIMTGADERAYLIGGRLLSGRVGTVDGVRAWSFRVWHSATSTHTITFTDPGTFGTGDGAKRFLSTMTFGE